MVTLDMDRRVHLYLAVYIAGRWIERIDIPSGIAAFIVRLACIATSIVEIPDMGRKIHLHA